MTSPNDMLPARNFGAHSNTGITGASCPLPWETTVVRMC